MDREAVEELIGTLRAHAAALSTALGKDDDDIASALESLIEDDLTDVADEALASYGCDDEDDEDDDDDEDGEDE